MSLMKWAVNIRMENKGIKMPKEVVQWALENYAKKDNLDKVAGYYKKFEDGSIGFIGSSFVYSPFSNCFGWFPKVFPFDDPYQSVYRGMTAEQFTELLESLKFKIDL